MTFVESYLYKHLHKSFQLCSLSYYKTTYQHPIHDIAPTHMKLPWTVNQSSYIARWSAGYQTTISSKCNLFNINQQSSCTYIAHSKKFFPKVCCHIEVTKIAPRHHLWYASSLWKQGVQISGQKTDQPRNHALHYRRCIASKVPPNKFMEPHMVIANENIVTVV